MFILNNYIFYFFYSFGVCPRENFFSNLIRECLHNLTFPIWKSTLILKLEEKMAKKKNWKQTDSNNYSFASNVYSQLLCITYLL